MNDVLAKFNEILAKDGVDLDAKDLVGRKFWFRCVILGIHHCEIVGTVVGVEVNPYANNPRLYVSVPRIGDFDLIHIGRGGVQDESHEMFWFAHLRAGGGSHLQISGELEFI